MNNVTRILIVEDLPADYDLAQREIRKAVQNCEFKRVENEKEFLQALENFQPALILSDYELPSFNGLKALELARKHTPATPFLIWSGVISEDAAVESMKNGASNYIFKENLKRLGPAVARALEERQARLEYQEAEETVKNNERRFRALIENGLDSISLLAADGSLLWESPAITRILDFAPDEFLGRSLFELMHPDDLPWTRYLFTELLKEPGSRQHKSFRLRHSDGTWRLVEAVVTNMLNEPAVNAIVVNYRDITERKQAEDALRESEEKYRLLFQNNPLPMWIYDLETLRFLKVNDAAVNFYGYSMEDFLAMTIKDIRPALDVPMLMENIAISAIRENQQVDRAGIWRHFKKDGTMILVDIISHPVEFDGRKGELVLAHDVTRQKQAESEIQQRNDDLALITALNEVINQGQGLDAVVQLMTRELKRFSSGGGVTIYLLSPDGKSLQMQQYFLAPEISRKIEKLIGRAIPNIQIPLQEGGYFEDVLRSKRGRITSDPQVIQRWMAEFVETPTIPSVARSAIRRMIPQIYKLLNIKSTVLIPLIWEGETLGLLDVSSPHIFSVEHLKRIENIGGQLTTAIRRKQVEDALKEERNLLRTLIDNLPDRIYVMDNEGRKTISNTSDWKASGGQTMEDVIGRTDFDTYPPDLAEQFWQVDREVIDSGQPVIDYEEPGLDFEGNRVSILTTKIPLRNEEGKVVGLVGIGRDITERKQAEARINDLLAFNERILDNSPLGILTYKITGECVYANENAASILGTTVEVLQAQNFLTIESWRKSGLYDLITKAITTQELVSSDIHHVSTFGKEIWMTVHCVTFKSKDEDLVFLSLSDISIRKASEIERQALLEIMQGLANTNDLQEFLTLIHSAIARVIYAENLFVVLHKQESGLFEEIYSVDQYDPPGLPSSLEKSITSYVFRTGEPLLLTQERFDELAAQGEVELVGTNSASWLGAPLTTLHGTIGVIAVQNYENRHCYTESDKDFLASIATQVALAIERKRAEETLRESEERYRLFVENSGEAILVTRPDGTVDSANPEACRIFGRNEDELRSLGRAGVVDIDDPRLRSALDERRTGQFKGELHLLRKDGTAFLSEVSTTVFKDSHGNERTSMIIRDITERKRAEDLVRESRARLAEAQVIAKVGSWETDLATLKVIWSEETYRIFELDPNTFHASHSAFLDFVHPEDRKKVDDAFIASLENDSYNKIEHRLITSQGKIKFIEERWQVVHDTQGRPWRAVGTCQDITERKQAEERLRESEARFGSAFENASIGIGLLTLEGQWFKVNRAICEMLGYSVEELLILTFQTITHPEDLERDLNQLRQLLAGRINSYQMEKRYFHKSGHVIWALLSVSLVRNNEGKPLYFISQIQDITERKQAENAEREQRALAEALRDTAETLNSTLDYGEVLDRILTAVGPVVPHDAGTIMLIDGESAYVVRSHGYDKRGVHDEISGIRLSLAETNNLRQMLETGKTVIVHDTHSYMGWKRLPATDWLRSNVGAPISIYGEVIGFILLDSETIGFFTPVHAERLEAFANQAALAIHNARLLQQAQKEIADRRLAEDALRESESLYRQAIEVAGAVPYYQSYYDNGKSIKYEFIGQGIRQITGYGPEEFNARVWNSLVEEVNLVEDLTGYSLDEGIQRVRLGKNPIWKCEHRIRDRDGKIHWVFEAAVEIRDENGISRGSIGTYQDITGRKQAEIELRASEERFRQLANNIEEVFWMTDAESGREIYLSPAAEKVWGRSLDYLMNEPNAFINSVLPEDQPAVLHALQQERDGEKVEVEYRVVDADGSIRWIWDRAFPIFGEDGSVKTLAGIAADITDRKKAEFETRRHLVELEALYENGLAVGQLLEPGQIGNRIIETFARHLSWHHVAIRLLRPETDDLELIAFNQLGLSDEERSEMERHFNKMINKVGQGLSGWVAQTGEPFRTGDVHAHSQYVDTHAGITSGLYMPLKVADRTIGCISVESEQADAFSAQDERLLATLANQAAIAFENARLYSAVQQELLERKQAQAALWASETHYRELADSITDVLFEMDHEQRYTHWNKASEMLTGIPAKDAIGSSMGGIFGNAEEQARNSELYESVFKSRQAKTFETEFIVKGQRRAFEINAYPSIRGVAVVARDVTERKVSETLMQKRVELMEYATRHSLDQVMQRMIEEVSELTGSHIGFLHFVEADQVTINLQAWSSETVREFCSAEGEKIHYPVEQAGVWADAVRQRQPLIHNDYESLTGKKGVPEGHPKLIREMVIPVIRNEKIVAVIGVGNKEQEYTQQDIQMAVRFADYAWDITERKQMESALADERNQLARRVEERTADLSRANSNLARALHVKDEFLANMSHELRTPLNAILGLSESLGEQVAGPLNEKQQKYLTTINESGHHLLSLINDILDLAKIEAGQITLDINKVDVNSVCQASLRMIKQLAQKKDQEVVLEIDHGLGLMWADERRLKQMIVNLLSNAVKFTPEAGKIGLEVRGDEAGNRVILTVWDNGVGISEGDMNRLFRPFVQLDASLAREATGTGLGLALVAQMARLHGGSVSVTSLPGEGSRFSIQLPWEPALAADAAIRLRNTAKFRAIDPNAKNKPTILLIEDTREVVMMLVDYLEMTGFKIVTAQDGVDGLTQAKLTPPDLILMDIQMPRMDGFETTQKLRSDPQFKDTPIIALTALAMPNDRQRCIEAGMDEYMSKPVNLKALVKMLHKFLLQDEDANR